jgi:hypothetical protein
MCWIIKCMLVNCIYELHQFNPFITFIHIHLPQLILINN